MTVMPVYDEPLDENWKLGISHKHLFAPFNTDGTTVYFDSRVPAKREIPKCTRIIMTGETE